METTYPPRDDLAKRNPQTDKAPEPEPFPVPIPPPSLETNLKHDDEKSNEPDSRIEEQPPRQSMSPRSSKGRSTDSSPRTTESRSESMINQNAVLIIPLDNRVTPQMVADKFVKYGKILQVRPIKKSSTCIVIFSRASEAANCIRLFESHDKVRVTRPNQFGVKLPKCTKCPSLSISLSLSVCAYPRTLNVMYFMEQKGLGSLRGIHCHSTPQ